MSKDKRPINESTSTYADTNIRCADPHGTQWRHSDELNSRAWREFFTTGSSTKHDTARREARDGRHYQRLPYTDITCKVRHVGIVHLRDGNLPKPHGSSSGYLLAPSRRRRRSRRLPWESSLADRARVARNGVLLCFNYLLLLH